MTIRNTFWGLSILALFTTCEPDLSDDAIPWQPFDLIQINLNLPQYVSLRTDGGSMTIDGGVRGIIVYHQSGSNYIAYEANCSFQPNAACATVEVHVSTLFLFCACCSSNFDLATGYPTSGPAWRPLRRYSTSLNGSTLTITDVIVE
ncbi:MAG: hypothetical protein M3Y60_00930 [Bacteroidota bacterium]|nr:hypothetical protein [Bacteroidota bacterium]